MITLTNATFDDVVAKHDLVVIDFWAKWCKPCLHFSDVFDKVAAEFSDVQFAKVDIETEPELTTDFNIRSIPFLIIIKKGVVIYAEAGELSQAVLTDLVMQAINLDLQN